MQLHLNIRTHWTPDKVKFSIIMLDESAKMQNIKKYLKFKIKLTRADKSNLNICHGVEKQLLR